MQTNMKTNKSTIPSITYICLMKRTGAQVHYGYYDMIIEGIEVSRGEIWKHFNMQDVRFERLQLQ